MNDLINTLLAKGGFLFATVMMKIQKPWEKHRLLIMFTLGLLMGWLILGWAIFPVSWQDAPPSLLEPNYRNSYLTFVAMEYNQTRNIETAALRLGYPDWKLTEIQGVLTQLQEKFPLQTEIYQRLANDLSTYTPPAEPSGPISIWVILGGLLLVLAIVGAIFFLLLRMRGGRTAEPSERVGRGPSLPAEKPAVPEGFVGEQLGSFVTTYVLGDDYFDPSFSIEMGADFLGECGVGVSESIGVGDPKKVTAYEVWLFDKSDIRTVVTVLTSEYAFNDPALRSKLAAKGEVAIIRPGMTVDLETTALRVRVLIKDVDYAQGNLPPHSFFQKVTFQLEAWVKQEPSAPL